MHLNILVPLTCLLATLTAAAPTGLSLKSLLPPHGNALEQRAPGGKGRLGFDGDKRDAFAEPARKGHFGGPVEKRETFTEFAHRGHLITGNH